MTLWSHLPVRDAFEFEISRIVFSGCNYYIFKEFAWFARSFLQTILTLILAQGCAVAFLAGTENQWFNHAGALEVGCWLMADG